MGETLRAARARDSSGLPGGSGRPSAAGHARRATTAVLAVGLAVGLVLLLTGCGRLGAAPDVAGVWVGEGDFDGGTVRFMVSIDQEGEDLSGHAALSSAGGVDAAESLSGTADPSGAVSLKNGRGAPTSLGLDAESARAGRMGGTWSYQGESGEARGRFELRRPDATNPKQLARLVAEAAYVRDYGVLFEMAAPPLKGDYGGTAARFEAEAEAALNEAEIPYRAFVPEDVEPVGETFGVDEYQVYGPDTPEGQPLTVHFVEAGGTIAYCRIGAYVGSGKEYLVGDGTSC